MKKGQKFYFGTNTKMYKTVADTLAFVRALNDSFDSLGKSAEELELFVIPSYTALADASRLPENSHVRLGAQNMGWELEGQFTGEISSRMLRELGISFAMVGHSERRHVLGESDQEENRKILHGLSQGFTMLLCIGETGEEKEYGISPEVLRQQLKIGLHSVKPQDLDRIWIAYEPVWAIGVGGQPASASYANAMHLVIKNCLHELFGDASQQIPVLYGGSVNRENACALIQEEAIDGLFIGRSAWDADNFLALMHEVIESIDSHS